MKTFKSLFVLFTSLTICGFSAPQTAAPSSKTPIELPPVPSPAIPTSPTKDLPPGCEEMNQMSDSLTYENMFMKTILALVGLLLIIFLAVWVLKKLSSSRTRQMNLLKTVKVLEKRPISPKSVLYLIEVAGKKVLISESQFEVRTISHLEWIDIPPQDIK